jgi:hypothetical protein
MPYHTPMPPKDDAIWALLKQYTFNFDTGQVFNPKGKEVGSPNNNGYWVLGFTKDNGKHKSFLRYHVIYWAYHGIWPNQEIDHKDRNKANDSISNLQPKTHRENCINSSQSDNRQLPVGVYPYGNRGLFQAKHMQTCIGKFTTPEAANVAYQQHVRFKEIK